MKQKAEENGPKWADKQDIRVTKVGKFLRKWRIDEIPQFWNIIKGDMSIVGPRPERPEFDKILSNDIPQWGYRSLVKPGLTGWAQIRSQYASDEKVHGKNWLMICIISSMPLSFLIWKLYSPLSDP